MKYLVLACLLFSSLAHADDPKYLLVGTPAPFTGYLISQDTAEKIRKDALELTFQSETVLLLKDENSVLSQRLSNAQAENDHLAERVSKSEDNFFSKAGYFILGAALTTAIAYGASRSVR